MGNSLPGNGYKHVGNNVGIRFKRGTEDAYFKEEKLETSMVSYEVGKSNVTLFLKTTYGKDGDIKLLQFQVLDPGFLTFAIYRTENNLLHQTEIVGELTSYETNFVNKPKNQWGVVTKTNVLYSGSENKGHLLVVEEKRKGEVEQPFAVTVAHYYAVSSRSFINRKKYDVGLSIVVDIRLSKKFDLVLSVDGPSEHPPSALLQTFKQVSRTWTWKWTACPHCAAEYQMRQRSGENGQQFETENDEERKYLQWTCQIGGSVISNDGVINGNNNCSMYVNQLILKGG